MFAIGIWDASSQRLLLARDRLGEKPLYYTLVGDEFLFASEIKALFEADNVPRCVDPEALPLYLSLGYTPPPRTMFAGICKLAPGELLIVDRSSVEQRRYWRPAMNTRGSAWSYDAAVKRVRDAVTEAVESRLMSDVPLGAFLSGGVDSTAVVAIMARLTNQPVRTFTVGFRKHGNKFNVDDQFAALAAERLKTEHHRIQIREDDNLAVLLPHLIYSMDEPIAQSAIIQTVHVAALARQHGVPVLLSGDGGDELFAGYTTYRLDRILSRYLQIPGLLRKAVLTPLLERAPKRFDDARKLAAKSRITDPVQRYLIWMNVIDPARLPALLANGNHDAAVNDLLGGVLHPLVDAPHTLEFTDRIAFTSLCLWLAEDSNMRVDKMSMAMSIEARAPLEDHGLVELAFSLPLSFKLRGGTFKAVFKDAFRDLIPPEIVNRPKWGFFPPVSNWLRGIFRPLVDRFLSPDYVAAVGCFDPDSVARIVALHMSKRSYEMQAVWSLLVFHMWHALFIDRSLTLDTTLTPADLVADLSHP
jgi:asparagine synthase (glutamine-hydrolysing)